MTDENTAPPADDNSVAPPAEPETPVVEDTGVSEAEADALEMITGDVKGEVTQNEASEPLLKTKEVDDDGKGTDGDDTTPADDTKPASAEGDESEDSAEEQEDKPGDTDAIPKPEPLPVPEPAKVEAPAPQPAPKLEDPGDFKPSDYSFEFQTLDGKTHKISSPEEAEAFVASLDE